MAELLEYLARQLVDDPDAVQVDEGEDDYGGLVLHLHVAEADIGKVIASTVAKGAEFADVFFEYRITSNFSFEEDIVKSARRGIVQGVGIRAVKGDQIGFAFTEDLVGSWAAEPTMSRTELLALLRDVLDRLVVRG